MCHATKVEWSKKAMENGHNWNTIRLLTGCGKAVRGHQLTAINFTFREEGVLVIMKKESKKGPMVAFFSTADLDSALLVVAHAVKSRTIPWKPDKFRSMRNDKT